MVKCCWSSISESLFAYVVDWNLIQLLFYRHVGVLMALVGRVPVTKWPSMLRWHLLNGH